MRLDPDCIRDILFFIEENSNFRTSIEINDICNALNYEENKTKYHINQCDLYGYLINVKWDLLGNGYVDDITPKAHEFIANIRSDNIWKKVLEKASIVGSFSLDILSQVAANLISSQIL